MADEEPTPGGAGYSSTATFEEQPMASNLSSDKKTPREIDESASTMVRNNLHKWNTTGDVIHLSHGRVGGKPSTLLVLRFRFCFEPRGSSRFSKAEITLQFLSGGGKKGIKPPAVLKYAPYLIHSRISPNAVSKTLTHTAGISGPSIPARFQVKATSSERYVREERTEVLGWSWTSDDAWENNHQKDDAVRWTLTENKLEKDGIPRELTAAVLLERSEVASFCIAVEVTCKTSSGVPLFGWPWSKPNPLVIRTDTSFGTLLQNQDFDSLDEQTWQSFVAIDRPYQVRDSSRHN